MKSELHYVFMYKMLKPLLTLRPCLVIVFENSFKKQYLRIVFKNCFLMFCKTNVYLGEMFLIIKK